MDQAAEADHRADEQVDAHLVDHVLPIYQVIFPLLFQGDEKYHEEAGEKQHEAPEEHAEEIGGQEDDDHGEKNAPQDEHNRVHDGYIMRMVALEPIEKSSIARSHLFINMLFISNESISIDDRLSMSFPKFTSDERL